MKITTHNWSLSASVEADILILESFDDSSVSCVPLKVIERIDSFQSKAGDYEVSVDGKGYNLSLEGLSATEAKDVVLRLGYAAFSSTELQDLNLVR